MRFLQAFCTNIGPKRSENQDSLAIVKAETDRGDVLLSVVCDGMGGHSQGELASRICVEAFADWFRHIFPRILADGAGGGALRSGWKNLVKDLNHRLYLYGEENRIRLGSTLTASLFWQGMIYIVHAGDTRCYCITDQARQITEDHSLTARELKRGAITPEEAAVDKRRNVLTECVGITNSIRMEFYAEPVEDKAVYLLCSDGFWHTQSGAVMAERLWKNRAESDEELQSRLQERVEYALSSGETDNITVVGVIPDRTEEALPETDDDPEGEEITSEIVKNQRFEIVLDIIRVHGSEIEVHI